MFCKEQARIGRAISAIGIDGSRYFFSKIRKYLKNPGTPAPGWQASLDSALSPRPCCAGFVLGALLGSHSRTLGLILLIIAVRGSHGAGPLHG
jgi:hypothetical protein